MRGATDDRTDFSSPESYASRLPAAAAVSFLREIALQ